LKPYCKTCKRLGSYPFRSGRNEGRPFLTVFEEGVENMKQWTPPSKSYLGKFIARIDLKKNS
jgi:hypothetical protein